MIDFNLSAGMVFEQFIAAMHNAGCEVKRGNYLSFRIPGTERFVRVKSIGEAYTEEALRERCVGKRIVAAKTKTSDDIDRKAVEYSSAARKQYRPTLLINIQSKLQQAHSPGFEHFATSYNLKEIARTLIFMKENGIGTYEELTAKINSSSKNFNANQARIKELKERLNSISEL